MHHLHQVFLCPRHKYVNHFPDQCEVSTLCLFSLNMIVVAVFYWTLLKCYAYVIYNFATAKLSIILQPPNINKRYTGQHNLSPPPPSTRENFIRLGQTIYEIVKKELLQGSIKRTVKLWNWQFTTHQEINTQRPVTTLRDPLRGSRPGCHKHLLGRGYQRS